MKARNDLVRGWLRKASSDVVAMDASLNAGALDAACFHAQQAAEKCLKAFLLYHGKDFPYTHNLPSWSKSAANSTARSVLWVLWSPH